MVKAKIQSSMIICDAGPIIHLDEIEEVITRLKSISKKSTLHLKSNLLQQIIKQVEAL